VATAVEYLSEPLHAPSGASARASGKRWRYMRVVAGIQNLGDGRFETVAVTQRTRRPVTCRTDLRARSFFVMGK